LILINARPAETRLPVPANPFCQGEIMMKTVTNAERGRLRPRRDMKFWPDDFDVVRDDIEQWMSDRMRGLPGFAEPAGFPADMDMIETDGEIELAFDVPGFRKEDIELDIEPGRVTVRGRREAEKEKKSRSYIRMERVAGQFERSVKLPVEVDAEGAAAELKDGVLRITLKKAVKSAPARRIEIR
jgi:HSP20 family protein